MPWDVWMLQQQINRLFLFSCRKRTLTKRKWRFEKETIRNDWSLDEVGEWIKTKGTKTSNHHSKAEHRFSIGQLKYYITIVLDIDIILISNRLAFIIQACSFDYTAIPTLNSDRLNVSCSIFKTWGILRNAMYIEIHTSLHCDICS